MFRKEQADHQTDNTRKVMFVYNFVDAFFWDYFVLYCLRSIHLLFTMHTHQ
ncbi:hypothetical protein PRUPE_3G279100 [Prunus persica]|uniref:Uncharacterized protein n=1 Tax=Prunus persica TaxID=3760 RepID=A0A251Q6P1_PRUPE|nr:hypothetical protein PRUPE_3G279100 [Prunus persica]